ncbi:MAG: acyltransferase family protein [Clostridiales bacterium]|nr:acyltransferase family protein [Clostridiales bacterium]
MMTTGKRLEWVDTGKFICIMFVMLSHLESGSDILSAFYSPFVLRVFFFLSGYVYKQPATFREHFVKKVKGLFVPWLIFSNFNIFLSAIISLHGERNTLSELAWNALQIRGSGDGVWFVAALFVAFIPFYFIIKWNKPAWACAVAAVLSLASVLYSNLMNPEFFPWGSTALPWHLDYMFKAMLWMVLGYYFKVYGEAVFDKLNTVRNRAVLWAVYLIAAYIPETIGGGYWSIPLSYIRGILGIFAILSICKIMRTNRYISFIGANTLTYFGLHGKLYAVIEAVLGKFSLYGALLENAFTSSVVAIVITVAMSLILIVPAMIINRWFPWVLGRKAVNSL